MGWYRNWGKRFLDVALVLIASPALVPGLAVIGVLVRVVLGAPVLYRQQRPGLHGQPFTLVKFRTMSDATSPSGEPLPDEARLTRFGRLLRSTSLDELPGLWNVLRGDMSLVGPRPLLMRYLPRYSATQRRRHEVRPGVTGWAQVNGRNALSWDEKFDLDVWYVDHVGFRLDVRILWRTVVGVLGRRGVSAAGHATMPEFMGSDTTGERVKLDG